MKKTMFPLLCVLVTIASFLSPARAAVNLDRTRIVYPASNKSVSVMLHNQSRALPYLAQVWLEDADGERIASPLMALPPLQRIEPGQKSLVRILQMPEAAGLPTDRESLFYFNVREVPPQSAISNVMQVAIQSRIKLFFRPDALAKQARAKWQDQLQLSRLSNGLKLTNPTPFYITLGYLGKDNRGNLPGFDSLMLSPFATETLTGQEYVSPKYSLGYLDDHGGMQINHYRCQASDCQLVDQHKPGA